MPIFSRFSCLSLIISPALVKSSPTVLTSAGAPDGKKYDVLKQKDQQMKQIHTFSIISGALVVSAALITGLAGADMTADRKHKSMMHAQKLDTNDDGAISLDELTTRQDRRFTKLDHDDNGMIEKREFNARLIAMFQRMDRDGDGVLRGDELPGHRYGGKTHLHGDKASDQ